MEKCSCYECVRHGCECATTEDSVITDNPDWDGTDYAHPAWWRGNDRSEEHTSELQSH